MPALRHHRIDPEPAAPALAPVSRVEVLQLISAGSLADALWAGEAPASPAHALQQRLLEAYVATPVRGATKGKLPRPVRGAIILGTAVALWVGIAGAAMLAF